MKRLILLCLLAVFVMGSVHVSLAAEAAPPAAGAPPAEEPPKMKPAVNVGDEVPPWSGKEIDSGKEITSESLKGKNYALVFVNSACSACRGEMADISKLNFTDALHVIVVSMDLKPDKAMAVYRDLLKLPYPILGDPDQKISDVVDFNYTPASVIVDKAGKVVFRMGGYSPKLKSQIMDAFAKYAK